MTKIPLTGEIQAYEHALAFTVARMADKDMLNEIHQAMEQAIANKTSFNQFAKTLRPYLMAKGWLAPDGVTPTDKAASKAYQKQLTGRLKTIFHTNKATAYAAGQWQRIQDTKERYPYLQYMPSVSTHKRDEHKRYYHLVRPVDDPIWRSLMPPNGFGCKCFVKQLNTRQAQKQGISDPVELETDDNGVPKGIDPSFNHNHDRLTALLKLAEEKHGTAFKEALGDDLKDYMVGMARQEGLTVADFKGIVARQSEIDRLILEGARRSEAILADQWQQYHNVKIVGFDEGVHKFLNPPNPPDLAEVNVKLPPKEWRTLDIMYTLESHADPVAFNKGFHKSDKAWQKAKTNIIKHIKKADIVPMYLDHMDEQTTVKIVSFVLSLSEQEQKKIVFIWGNKP